MSYRFSDMKIEISFDSKNVLMYIHDDERLCSAEKSGLVFRSSNFGSLCNRVDCSRVLAFTNQFLCALPR